jgi:hypothetical protein
MYHNTALRTLYCMGCNAPYQRTALRKLQYPKRYSTSSEACTVPADCSDDRTVPDYGPEECTIPRTALRTTLYLVGTENCTVPEDGPEDGPEDCTVPEEGSEDGPEDCTVPGDGSKDGSED